MTFIPVKPAHSRGRTLKLEESFTFPATPLPWRFTDEATATKIGPILVDTNGDLTPDTQIPGPSNFLPGLSPNQATTNRATTKVVGGGCYTCHSTVGHEHCWYPPGPPFCAESPDDPPQ